MGPPNPWTYALERFAVFLRDVIEPAVFPASTPMDAEAFQTLEPVPARDAFAAAYSPVKLGWQWGPRWSTAWFRLRGVVPAHMAGRHVMLRFSTDTEALLWLPDASGTPVPHHGLDMNRDAITLYATANGGERVELHVEAACNHMFGDRGLQWDPPEIHRRWNSETPGLFERCELAVRDDAVWRLKHVYAFALDLAKQMAPDSPRGQQLLGVLRRATNMLPDDAVAKHAAEASALIESVLRPPLGGAAGSATLCHAVGHAHIDTAWLWPLRETKRKCLRTFSTVLRNMEADPDYRFLCSQAQQYEYVRERSPELFEQIKRRVAEGRWEPGGAMWIEPDCTCPSGESLIRQCLYADRYWRSHFGDKRGAQRFLYLPDTFGFPAQLPQIMRHCGLDTFITNKLHWNSTNVFPHTTFLWRGLDGSTVLAHQTPGMDYNASNTPKELIRGEKTHKNKDLLPLPEGGGRGVGSSDTDHTPRVGAASPAQTNPPQPLPPGGAPHGARWLQPFGFGDGGGGPTDWSILYARLAQDCDALPRVRFSTATDFCDALHHDVQHALKNDPHAVPTHDGELYLELHRGTYTTHARIKQANAECEELLRQAEILTFAGPTRLPREQELSAKAELDRAWKLVLLNQFHDILPGSSITWVYEDAAKDYAEVRRICEALIDAGMRRWASHLSSGEAKRPVALFNLSNGSPGPFCEAGGEVVPAHTLRPLSVRVVDADSRESTFADRPIDAAQKLSVRGHQVSHAGFSVEFNDRGEIVSLRCPGEPGGSPRLEFAARNAGGPLNRLRMYEDRPRLWDAWDIDAEHAHKPAPIDSPCEAQLVHSTPERVSMRFTRALGRASHITQTFTVFAASHTVHVDTEVDWREEHRLLRVEFPTGARREDVLLGTQFGRRTPPACPAAFEVPFQRTIEDTASGLTFAFPDKYGASISSGVIGVSLLRAPRYPDPTADIGIHRFSYAISAEPHALSTDAALRPCRSLPLAARQRTIGPDLFGPLITGSNVEAIKLAEDGDRLIVRLSHGDHARTCVVRWRIPVANVEPVDGLERPIRIDGFQHDREQNVTTLPNRPFQIVTLAVTRAD